MQIQYNITRIEEWCKSHDMPEGTLQLEHLMQATKLLQLKKVSVLALLHRRRTCLTYITQSTPADIEIIYDVCWMLTPTQIQRMCTNYYVADYEVCDNAGQSLCSCSPCLRTRFLPRSFALSRHELSLMTATTISSLLRKRRKLGHMNCHSRERSQA